MPDCTTQSAQAVADRKRSACAAIIGICRADPDVAQPLMPEVMARFETAAGDPRHNRARMTSLARALIRHGHKADVERIIAEYPSGNKRGRVSQRDLNRDAGFDPRFCG